MPEKKQSSANKPRWASGRSKLKGAAEPQSRPAHKTEGNKRHGRTTRRAKA